MNINAMNSFLEALPEKCLQVPSVMKTMYLFLNLTYSDAQFYKNAVPWLTSPEHFLVVSHLIA